MKWGSAKIERSWLGLFLLMICGWGSSSLVVADEEYYEWPSYSPTLAYDYIDEYGPINPPTEILDDVSNVSGSYADGWWCFRYGPNKNSLVTSEAWIPMVERFNEDFDYITHVMRWPRDLRARNGYYSTIYLFGSGLSTDSASNTEKGGWQSATHYDGQSWPMVLASYYPVYAFDSDSPGDGAYQRGAMIHEGIHCILASMPGCKKSAWFHEGGNTWLQGTMESLRSGDFSSVGWLSAGAAIAPFMPIECYSGWLQDGSFGGPAAEGVNRFANGGQLCTWRNLLGGTQYGECFPHAMATILGPKSIAWMWRNCYKSGRVLQDMAQVEGGLGDAQMRRLIQEYRARQAFCDFGSWSYAFMKLLNNNWRATIDAEYPPYWIDCDPWTATCYVATTEVDGVLFPEERTLPGWSGANQIPLTVNSHAATASVTFNPIGTNMRCQLVYRDMDGNVRYGVPVSSGICSIPLSEVKNKVVVAVVCNTDYVFQGEQTRTAKYDYTLGLGAGVTGRANIYTQWYNHRESHYTLTASSSDHGSISPSGDVSVNAGANRLFTMTPDPNYVVESVAIDGVEIDQVTEYTFRNVRGDHRIAVTFAPPSFSLWATAGNSGSINPSGEVLVRRGDDQTFIITPNDGYEVYDVTIDGVSIGAVTEYTLTEVDSDHVLLVEFSGSSSAVPAASDLLFMCNTDSLPDSGSTGDWQAYLPGGVTLSMINSPTVKVVEDVKWVETLYRNGDGYTFGSYSNFIACKGVSIVVAVLPLRTSESTAWTSIVDAFYSDLVLGLNNKTGKLQVWRKGTRYDTQVTIPNGQKTVLSLIVQPNGQFKIYANGKPVYFQPAVQRFAFLSPGVQDYMHSITVGRNAPDQWSTFNGYIGDVFFYKTALSDADREELEEALTVKFSL